MKFFWVLAFVLFSSSAKATVGCLIDNTFYTSYIGNVTTTNGSFSGSKMVFDDNGSSHPINYSGTNRACQVTASANGGPSRNGDLCFVMTRTQYNTYPNGVASNYPQRNGTLQDFTIYNCPIDEHSSIALVFVSFLGFSVIRKRGSLF